jgi:hypothetical protein
MKLGTTNHPDVGRRVEIPASSDMWMRGARFGTVERVVDRSKMRFLDPRDPRDPRGATLYAVRLEHLSARKRLYRYAAEDCRLVAS